MNNTKNNLNKEDAYLSLWLIANGAYSHSFSSKLRPIVLESPFYSLKVVSNFKCKQNKHPKEGSSGFSALVLIIFFFCSFCS